MMVYTLTANKPEATIETGDKISNPLWPGVVLTGHTVDGQPGQLVAEVGEAYQVLFNIQLDRHSGAQAKQLLHLKTGISPRILSEGNQSTCSLVARASVSR